MIQWWRKRREKKCKADQENDAKMDCDHGVCFDAEKADGLSSSEVRKRFPRLDGKCPKGCGFSGIGYASSIHYFSGDW